MLHTPTERPVIINWGTMLFFRLISLWVQPAIAADPLYTREDLEALAMIREADLGVERMYADDGISYYLALPDGWVTPTELSEGALTWEYVGQAWFHEPMEPLEGVWSTTPEYLLTGFDTDLEEYLGLGTQTRVDQYGRLWVVNDIDIEAAERAIAAYDAEIEARFGWVEPGIERPSGIEYPSDAGARLYSTLDSTQVHSDCEGDSRAEYSISSAATWNEVPNPMTPRQETEVLIWGPNGACSGTMVDSLWVLTAAHCIADSSGVFSSTTLTACTRENLQTGAECKGAAFVVAKGGYYDGSVVNDYGVIKLTSHPTDTGYMALSTASDATISAYEAQHLGYPKWAPPSCTRNLITSDAQTVNDYYDGSDQWHAAGPILSTPSGSVRFDMSTGVGMSGGAYFYCPNGSCDNGYYMTAVHHGRNFSGTYYANGAKARDIRDWVIANTP